MNIIYLIEVFVTILIISWQFISFLRTKKRIFFIKNIFTQNELDNSFIEYKDSDGLEVETIKEEDESFTESFKNILFSINRYLEKNKGAADFSIIKSVVDRSVVAKENDIASVVSTPLYLGLMGTFIGVILGLLRIAFSKKIDDENIHAFIAGILIAMTASLMGLILTTVNNSFFFKKAKSINDDRKNKFFNFLQIELLPHLESSLYSALDRLRINLNDFNENIGKTVRLFDQNFTANVWHLKESVEGLSDNINPIIENTNTQKAFLQELRSIGYNRMAEANVKVFTLMKEAGPNFIAFIQKQKELNESMDKANTLVLSIKSIMDRIKTFEDNINKLGERIDNADYMSSDLLKKVNKKLSALDDQFEALKQHSLRSNDDIYRFFEQEGERIASLTNHIRNEVERALDLNIDENPFQKLLLLDKLHELENLKILDQDNKNLLPKIDRISSHIEDSNKQLKEGTRYLTSIDKNLTEINEEDDSNRAEAEEVKINEDGTTFWGR